MISTRRLHTVRPPGQRCRRCGRRHRHWYTVARCLWPVTLWLRGWPPEDGPCYAVLSHCGPGLTVKLYATEVLARQALRQIDDYGCGGQCRRAHELVTLCDAGPGGS